MDSDTIDWVLTEEYLIERFNAIKGFELERRTNEARRAAERGDDYDLRTAFDNLSLATLNERRETKPNKRKPRGQLQGPPNKMSRFEGLRNFSGDVDQDEAAARRNLLEYYRENKEEMDRLVINPINKENNIMSGFKVVLTNNGSDLKIVKIGAGRADHIRTAEKIISWVYTVIYLKERLQQVQIGRRAKPYREATTEEERSVQSGMSAQTTGEEEAIQKINFIYSKLPWIDELKIRPILNQTGGPQESKSYYFGEGMKLYGVKDNKKTSGVVKEAALKKMNWTLTLNHIISELDTYDQLMFDVMNDGPDDVSAERGVNRSSTKMDSPEEFKMMRDNRSEIRNLFNTLGIDVKDRSDDVDIMGFAGRGVELKALAFEPERSATPRALRVKSSKIRLVGRGLAGAGRVSFAEDYVKPKRAKNLREVEGSGTASDLKYKRLGSKYIRVVDLKQNKLKVVYPNRTPLTPLREISPKLADLINKLVFENDIDQRLYGDLSLDDKRLFTELLKATHLQHHFTNTPNDPIEALKAEFDKLRGQVLLGNNNPDLIRELKSVAVDLYSQKLISENEFKSIVLI